MRQWERESWRKPEWCSQKIPQDTRKTHLDAHRKVKRIRLDVILLPSHGRETQVLERRIHARMLAEDMPKLGCAHKCRHGF